MHELPPDKLKIREVVHIDIANDPVANADYKEDEDPTKFKSVKTSRGPLVGKDWKNNVQPVMTCYKLVTCEFKWFGLQNRVENFIQKAERRLFTNFHRQVFCWIDRWYGLTMEDIRAIEERTKEELDRVKDFWKLYRCDRTFTANSKSYLYFFPFQQRHQGEVRGMQADI